MRLNIQQLSMVANEVGKFDVVLNLSPEQRQILHDLLRQASERLEEYKRQNPRLSKIALAQRAIDNRSVVRRRMTHFLTREQIGKWDAQAANEPDFLGLKIVA